MSNFPLYNSLYTKTSKDLTNKQKNELISNISLLDDKGLELVYALIASYKVNHNKSEFDITAELEFDLSKFDASLKRMLYKFVSIHLKTMEEEEKLKVQRQNC